MIVPYRTCRRCMNTGPPEVGESHCQRELEVINKHVDVQRKDYMLALLSLAPSSIDPTPELVEDRSTHLILVGKCVLLFQKCSQCVPRMLSRRVWMSL